METENKLVLQQKERSTGLIAILTNSDESEKFERSLTISGIVKNALPISELKRHVEPIEIKRTLDIHLTKLVASLNLKWTLNDLQIKQIVEDLLYKFPNESLEDFIIVFRKAKLGEFKNEDGNATIYRLDSAVIFDWMDKYLEEKYSVLESDLMKQKDEYKNQYIKNQTDYLQLWKEAIQQVDANGGVKTVTFNSTLKQRLNSLSPQQIAEQGKEKVKRAHVYPSTSISELRKHELHNEWIYENFDPRTGEKLTTYVDEQTWLKQRTI